MDSGRPQPESRHNIPHMQLFHHLKQKFPDLKDNDVNESIQKYGLDRERCEEELSQKTQLHHGGYYGPWGRSSSALSSPAMSRVTSPIRTTMPSPPTGVPSTPTTPVLTTTCPNSLPVHHHSTATHHVFGPLHSSGYLVYSYNPGIVGVGGPEPVYTSPTTVAAVATSPVFYQPPVSSGAVSYGWHPAVSNGVRASGVQSPPARHVQGGSGRQDSPFGSREASKSRSSTPVMPKSAPVVPNSFDPFSAYENKGPPERRKSEETHYNVRKNNHCNISEMEEEDFEIINHSPYHSLTPPPNTVDSPSTLTSTTTTLTTTTSSCTSPRTINGSSSGRPPAVVIAEQRVRKERLEAEVTRQLKEKSQLESEVEMMMRELQAREHQRKLTADTNTMRIEDVQKENQRLQSECYEMENKILRLAPDLETEVGLTLTSPTSYREAPHPPHLPRASSGSSLGSGTAGTPQTPGTPQQHFPGSYIPTRPAPPPPVPSPALHNHTYHDYQGVDGNTADEASGHKWGCSKCTFINHPDMNKCEICDYPRFTIGSQEIPGWAMV